MAKPPYEYKYFVLDHCETLADARVFPSHWRTYDECLEYIAEDAAEYEHDNCDGWEATWPLVFELFSLDDTPLGRFSVERETVPQFHATKQELTHAR